MSSNLSRPISEGELDYLRRAQGELIRTNGVMAMYAVALMAALALYFGYRIGGFGGNGWGLLLLGLGAALLAYAFRIAVFKNPAATMAFKPVLVNGLFSSRIVKSGNVPQKQYFIGDYQVAYPGHWHASLSGHRGPVIARAALPSWAEGTSQHLAALLLEVDDGPSIDFERANARDKHPISNPWISLAAVSTGLPALVLLGAYVSMASANQTNLGRSYQAVRAALLPVATFPEGDDLASREPPVGRVQIERAWRIGATSVENAPRDAMLVVVTQSTRDRILAARQQTSRDYAAAWQRFTEDLREYQQKWPAMPEAFPRPSPDGSPSSATTRPPRPRPPLVETLSLSPSDIIAYVTKSQAGRFDAPEGVDPVVAALGQPAPFTGELLATSKPYRLYPPDATLNWRDSGFALAVGIACLIAFLLFAWLITRDVLHRRAFSADVRAAYAEKRGYQLA